MMSDDLKKRAQFLQAFARSKSEDELTRLRAEVEAYKADAERWRCLIRHASLGFDGAPSWNAVIRLPVFDVCDQTITSLVDRVRAALKELT
jgi:hypothetical protein